MTASVRLRTSPPRAAGDSTPADEDRDRLALAQADADLILHTLSPVLIEVGADGIVNRWNDGAEATFGLAADEAVGQLFTSCGIRWSARDTAARIVAAREASARLDGLRFANAEGQDRYVTLTVAPILEQSGETRGCIVLGADVTEHKLLEEQLRQAQKLEAIGQLAAGI